jgi:phosphinothricin acetyltransferase
MASRIERVSSQYPWLVAEIEDQLAAYVYACQHRERAAYRWAVDVTVYVEQPYRRRGVARALYTCLISLLRRQGFMHAYAGITLPNEGSVGVHEAVGFQRIATYPAIGFKFGGWRDVGWWHLPLQSRPQDPAEPQPITRIRDLPETAALLAEASNMLGR